MTRADPGRADGSVETPTSRVGVRGGARAYWQRLSARERLALRWGGGVLAAALVWWGAVLPPWATLQAVDRLKPQLERQWQQMLAQQTQARAIQALPRRSSDEARRLLEAASRPLSPALQLAYAGDRVTVTVQALRAEALAQWLTQVQLSARLAPMEVRLRRSGPGLWDGTLVLPLSGS